MMKAKMALATLLGATSLAVAGTVRLEDCPAAVRTAIEANLRGGQLDEIDEIRIDDRVLYVAEIDLANGEDLKVHMNGDGDVLKTIEDLRVADVPPGITEAVAKLTPAGGRLEDVEREVADGVTRYHVEIDREGAHGLDVVLDESGAVLSQKEDIDD